VHHLQVGAEQATGGQRGDLALRGPLACTVTGMPSARAASISRR
jgi:hypothetical protein